MYGRTRFTAAVRLAPEYTDREVTAMGEGTRFSAERLLLDAMEIAFAPLDTLGAPLLLFSGRHDHNVSSSVSAEWFERPRAPAKTLGWFERTVHEVMNEEARAGAGAPRAASAPHRPAGG